MIGNRVDRPIDMLVGRAYVVTSTGTRLCEVDVTTEALESAVLVQVTCWPSAEAVRVMMADQAPDIKFVADRVYYSDGTIDDFGKAHAIAGVW